jgi:hypothetical protein
VKLRENLQKVSKDIMPNQRLLFSYQNIYNSTESNIFFNFFLQNLVVVQCKTLISASFAASFFNFSSSERIRTTIALEAVFPSPTATDSMLSCGKFFSNS